MRIPRQPRPYYLSYLIRDEESWRFHAKYGALKSDTLDRKRNALVDVRVGSYRTDQVRDGGLEDNDKEAESYGYVDLPFGQRLDGVRHGLWRLTDARYREAVETLLNKESHELTYRNPNRHFKAFEKRPARVDMAWRELPAVDRDYWTAYVERASAVPKRFHDIKDSNVELHVDHDYRIFVNSEGARQLQCSATWSLECYLWLLTEQGDGLPWTVRYMVSDPAELPVEKQFHREIREAVGKLRRLAGAPTVRSFSGPALLEPVPSGLLMHEAVGHRLEGNRLLASGEGQTFKDSLGQPILPAFLSMRDDPSVERFEGRSLVGHYRYDDEGVEAQEARLVTHGELSGYLTSRTGIIKNHRSNGHARSAYYQRPISRMGVLFVESNFQAFLGEVNLAAKVFPDGREEWIRGVNFVGTPLNAIRSIVAAGKRQELDNAYCGAESGYVPVSTISPALVVSELELQSKPETPYTQYSYPIPWEK
jgi:predicted Zn-dependent protease